MAARSPSHCALGQLERGIEDERLTLKAEDLGMRITYFATGPVIETSAPDRDFALPFA